MCNLCVCNYVQVHGRRLLEKKMCILSYAEHVATKIRTVKLYITVMHYFFIKPRLLLIQRTFNNNIMYVIFQWCISLPIYNMIVDCLKMYIILNKKNYNFFLQLFIWDFFNSKIKFKKYLNHCIIFTNLMIEFKLHVYVVSIKVSPVMLLTRKCFPWFFLFSNP